MRSIITAGLLVIAFSGWLTGAVDVKSDCPSIEIVSVVIHETQPPGAPWAFNEISLVLRNNNSVGLLGVNYAFNKELELATHGAGTASGMTTPFEKKDKILSGRTFQALLMTPIETQTINIEAALFEGDKWDGDPYRAEVMRADRAGMDARLNQVLGLLKSNMPDEKLAELIQNLPDIPAPRKFSANARRYFDIGTETGKRSILLSIKQKTREDIIKQLEEVLQ